MKCSYIYSINLLIRLIDPILFQLIYRKVGDNAYIPKKIHILFLLKKDTFIGVYKSQTMRHKAATDNENIEIVPAICSTQNMFIYLKMSSI